MSYILDALRKSEQERKLRAGDLPDLSTSHVGKSTSRPLWGYWLGTILLLGAGAAISLLWNRQAPNHDTDTMVQKPASVVPAPVHTPPPAPGMREASSPKARQTPPVISSASETPGLPAQPAQLAATPLPRDSADKPRQTDYSLALKRGHLAERLRELSTPELPGVSKNNLHNSPLKGLRLLRRSRQIAPFCLRPSQGIWWRRLCRR